MQELTYYLNHGSIPLRPAENHGSIWATAPFGLYPTAGHPLRQARAGVKIPAPVMRTASALGPGAGAIRDGR
jgi:hypothetical protein